MLVVGKDGERRRLTLQAHVWLDGRRDPVMVVVMVVDVQG